MSMWLSPFGGGVGGGYPGVKVSWCHSVDDSLFELSPSGEPVPLEREGEGEENLVNFTCNANN
jgi:hypothetical protein